MKFHLSLCVCRSVSLIDAACRQANDKLHRLSAVLPDAASLPPLEYDTSRRADPEVLQTLVSQAKTLRVSDEPADTIVYVQYSSRSVIGMLSVATPSKRCRRCIREWQRDYRS